MKKNKLFLLGMLGMVLTFGLMFVGCDNDSTSGGGGHQITIKNENAASITHVKISLYEGGTVRFDQDVTIAQDNEKTFSFGNDDWVFVVEITVNGSTKTNSYVNLGGDGVVTVILRSTGSFD
ncbi:hypothetical protein [Leadbettera azotonutricia]|uniref:Putative lipoprotein n=1 Tax=Leadbettera azotonutricia (strain ATCC BAA-888 / DSM 13862 / ZAS-9) TaxID=545695 RepID=F5YD91_LEAAZ|nr:hypothetical protein [Leadbettera azotonutricia]AEF80107.1 putative lipoprotein [Leadbettera azotonutricia ZAS-9]